MAKRKRKPADKPKFDLFKYETSRPEPFSWPEPEAEAEAEERELNPAEQRFEEFEAADYEGQLALCRQTIEEGTLMDGEMAFEMFNTIYYQTVERNERQRFEELAQLLRECLPEVYAAEAHYILEWQLTNALAEGREADILPLARELAPTAAQHLDSFTQTLDMLAYHGQLPALLEMMRLAWPDIQDSLNIFDWAIDEFANRAADYIIFDHLECEPDLAPDQPELQAQLSIYLPSIDQEVLARFLDYLTGRTKRVWHMSDFGFERQPPANKKQPKRPAKTGKLSPEAQQNLYELTLEFLRYLRQEEDVSYPKGAMARKELYQYLVERHAGELEARESMFEAVLRGNRPKPKLKTHYPDHWLCPDYATMDRFLGNLLSIFNGQFHQAVVIFELIPAWLHFLESSQLITSEQRVKTLQALRGMDTNLLKIFKTHADPGLPHAIERWRAKID